MVSEKEVATAKNNAAMDNRRTTSYKRHSPIQFQDLWFLEKLAQFDRETSNTHQRSTTGSGSNAPDK
ncbi:catalase [Pectobacterium actinidiae]|uniref:catalase n=1 Tax=Pectobacterium actinidiae TaxID=1507808 RepID=UPI0024A13411|nr:hypothetical protein Pcaca04_07170 [Pectobacterium carotovorum subsp. carotovorum]